MMWFRTVTILLKRYKAGRNWLMNGGLLLGMKRQTFATKIAQKWRPKVFIKCLMLMWFMQSPWCSVL